MMETLDVPMQDFFAEQSKKAEIESILILLKNRETKKEGIVALKNYILKHNHIITFYNNELFFYDAENGIYIPHGEIKIKEFIEKMFKDHSQITNHTWAETFEKIRMATYRENNTEDSQKICVQNGILDISDFSFSPHNPSFFFLNKMNVSYIPNQDCPKIKKFLQEITTSETDIMQLQEFIGYCIFKKYIFHKAFCLIGDGGNGKSTFLSLLKKFLGEKNCCSVSLQQLEKDKFAISNFFGKFANIYPDLSSENLRDTAMFKALTGNDMVMGEKKFQESFTFTNYAKLIFSCNKLPKHRDETTAFYRRWMIINFPNTFSENNQNPNLLEELSTESELAGLLNFSIEGLQRLLLQKSFTGEKTIEEIREKYLSASDSVKFFINEMVSHNPEAMIEKKELYTHYVHFCNAKKFPPYSENYFFRNIYRMCNVIDYRPEGNKRMFKGIQFVENRKGNEVKIVEEDLSGNNDYDFIRSLIDTEGEGNPPLLSYTMIYEVLGKKGWATEKISSVITKMKVQGILFEPHPEYLGVIK